MCEHTDVIHECGYDICMNCAECWYRPLVTCNVPCSRKQFDPIYHTDQYFFSRINIMKGREWDERIPEVIKAFAESIKSDQAPSWQWVFKELNEWGCQRFILHMPVLLGHPLEFLPHYTYYFRVADYLKTRKNCLNVAFVVCHILELHGKPYDWVPLKLKKTTIANLESEWRKICTAAGWKFTKLKVNDAIPADRTTLLGV